MKHAHLKAHCWAARHGWTLVFWSLWTGSIICICIKNIRNQISPFFSHSYSANQCVYPQIWPLFSICILKGHLFNTQIFLNLFSWLYCLNFQIFSLLHQISHHRFFHPAWFAERQAVFLELIESDLGGDVNLADETGTTPLLLAASLGKVDIVKAGWCIWKGFPGWLHLLNQIYTWYRHCISLQHFILPFHLGARSCPSVRWLYWFRVRGRRDQFLKKLVKSLIEGRFVCWFWCCLVLLINSPESNKSKCIYSIPNRKYIYKSTNGDELGDVPFDFPFQTCGGFFSYANWQLGERSWIQDRSDMDAIHWLTKGCEGYPMALDPW